MAKTLDFNKVNRPVLQLIMQDEGRTVIKVSCPTKELVAELNATLPSLNRILTEDDANVVPDRDTLADVYDLAARLISCNRSFITVTAEELSGKYRMDLESLLIFFGAYTDYITEITNAKN